MLSEQGQKWLREDLEDLIKNRMNEVNYIRTTIAEFPILDCERYKEQEKELLSYIEFLKGMRDLSLLDYKPANAEEPKVEHTSKVWYEVNVYGFDLYHVPNGIDEQLRSFDTEEEAKEYAATLKTLKDIHCGDIASRCKKGDYLWIEVTRCERVCGEKCNGINYTCILETMLTE